MYELPPILRGSEREQLAALRDYLVRLAGSLDAPVERVTETTRERGAAQGEGAASEAAAESRKLRALIVRTADTVRHELDLVTQELHEEYLALSDFGAYREQIRATVETAARGVVESYDFEAALLALDARLQTAEGAVESVRGEIRRGLLTDPDTGETVLGIAVAEKLSFTGAQRTESGLVYYELSPGQTLGLYTSTGWQFWINGTKRGWFDSRDGMLHVAQLAVESSLRLGGDWLVTTGGGWGLRYMGG